ncbi:AcrR family transcriptional regulator [Rhodococcus sp. 27YEA15]|uniref:TetR family transcriptional regulator n=1 Tax=Rhodococcus sp. 27YEA15 TaxID=3156259 RepID=UPI003C7D7E93
MPLPRLVLVSKAVPDEPESRAVRKERTRTALLDTAMNLLADRGFSGISLREVSREAGIVPTAFYRHFASMEELGVALVEDSMRMLRRMLRDTRRNSVTDKASASLEILVRQVHTHGPQFRFLCRERYGGVPEIRRAIATEVRLFCSELAVDLSRIAGFENWTSEDLEMAAELIVGAMFTTVVELLDAGSIANPPESEVIARAHKQLRLVVLGMRTWNPSRN